MQRQNKKKRLTEVEISMLEEQNTRLEPLCYMLCCVNSIMYHGCLLHEALQRNFFLTTW